MICVLSCSLAEKKNFFSPISEAVLNLKSTSDLHGYPAKYIEGENNANRYLNS